jgi:hypothetical protein
MLVNKSSNKLYENFKITLVLNINISVRIFKRHNQSTVKYTGKKYEIYKIRNKHHDSKDFLKILK